MAWVSKEERAEMGIRYDPGPSPTAFNNAIQTAINTRNWTRVEQMIDQMKTNSPDERVGTDHRDAALNLLHLAYEKGYMDMEEYDRRVSKATQATTGRHLIQVTHDMPEKYRWHTGMTTRKPSRSRLVSGFSPYPVVDVFLLFGLSLALTTALWLVTLPTSFTLDFLTAFVVASLVMFVYAHYQQRKESHESWLLRE